ncbi:HAMP domain-containing protein [Pelagibius litoralis]|uniref:histidine kinase n=1 Tax=Pelagibius litoralis TaxID=374515 RepID=A0A967F408_9PROT|nr:sensor histidine kinase [Pelagibius litoralis]NIA72426.1 HAMP domain-containing protein [Pelagibius litoralis]
MRYLTKLTLSFSVLLTIALVSAFLAFWSARSAEYHLERSHLAHRVHEQYLSLSSHTYQLFKQFGDAMLIGDRDQGTGEARLLGEIRNDITQLRSLIAEEVKMVGDEEVEELQLLSRIEWQIQYLLREFSRLQESGAAPESLAYKTQLSEILDEKIDADFQILIAEALVGEQAEVDETEVELRAAIALFQNSAVIAGLMAAITALFGIVLLRRGLTRPLQRLLEGAEAVGHGELDHRIEVSGGTELDRVAEAFNQMIAKVAERQDSLSASRDALELEVSRRTAQLEKLLQTLRQTEANRKRLLADVSHELRTPLTIIRGEADVALRGGDRDAGEYREVLLRTREAADHTARIVDDLLFVARQENGEIRINPQAVDLEELVRRAVAAGRALGETDKDVTLETAVTSAKVRADPRRIQQVITILLENALRYGGEEIKVRLDQAPGGFAVTVIDDGPGLTEEEREHVFERFFRGSNAALRYDGGAGLGLPVAKAIVEAHGGHIALTSEPGKGVQARFTLPARPRLAAAS